MKRIFLFALIGLFFLGCEKENNTPELPNTNSETPVTEAAFVYTEDTKLYVGYEAGETTFAFKANVEKWGAIVEENAEWLTVTPTSGDKGEQTLTIAFAENETEDDRQGKITISSGDSAFVITINQSKHGQVDPPKPDFEFAEGTVFEISVGQAEGETTFAFKANVDWESSIDQNAETWLSIDPSSGEENNWTLAIKYKENPDFEERKGTITISSTDGEESFEIKVTQAPSEKPEFEFADNTVFEKSVTCAEGTTTFDFVSNIDAWSATVSENTEWLTVTPTSGNKGNQTLTINYALNESEESMREGTITVKGNKSTFTIKVTQTTFDVFSIMDDEKFKEYCKRFDKNNDGKLSLSEAHQIKKVDVKKKNIASLKGIEYFVALNELSCYENGLTSLDLSNNTALTELDCSYNRLTSLNLSSNTALTFLDCNSNQLTFLNLSSCTALTKLSCNDNQLIFLNITNNTLLSVLRCAGNSLDVLDLSKNTNLTDLSCSSNLLTELDLSACTQLMEVYCWYNRITRLDLSRNTALMTLSCDYNQLTELDLSACENLSTLHCIQIDGYGDNILETIYFKEGQDISGFDIPAGTEIQYK